MDVHFIIGVLGITADFMFFMSMNLLASQVLN